MKKGYAQALLSTPVHYSLVKLSWELQTHLLLPQKSAPDDVTQTKDYLGIYLTLTFLSSCKAGKVHSSSVVKC